MDLDTSQTPTAQPLVHLPPVHLQLVPIINTHLIKILCNIYFTASDLSGQLHHQQEFLRSTWQHDTRTWLHECDKIMLTLLSPFPHSMCVSYHVSSSWPVPQSWRQGQLQDCLPMEYQPDNWCCYVFRQSLMWSCKLIVVCCRSLLSMHYLFQILWWFTCTQILLLWLWF